MTSWAATTTAVCWRTCTEQTTAVFVNYEIVRQGYAQPLTIPPNVSYSDLMVQAARQAEADDVGLWSSCG